MRAILIYMLMLIQPNMAIASDHVAAAIDGAQKGFGLAVLMTIGLTIWILAVFVWRVIFRRENKRECVADDQVEALPIRDDDASQWPDGPSMTMAQRRVLVGTAVVVSIMLFFPPYVVQNFRGVVLMAGYGFILSLPSYLTDSGLAIPATVNVPTLLAQVAVSLLVCGLTFLAARQ